MLLPCDLPSIKRFAVSLWETLEKGELVIISSPESCHSEIWLRIVLDAFNNVVHQMGDPVPKRLATLRGDCLEPTPILASALKLSETSNVPELMKCFGREPICILTVDCTEGLSPGWRTLFSKIGHTYRTVGTEVRQRPVLAILVGCTKFPPIEPTVGIRVKTLWNAVRWEELRLLVESLLASNENALARAWRIAVYSASSNSNPDVATLLCKEMPSSLSEAIECSLDALGCGTNTSFEMVAPFVADQRWNVPPAVIQQWTAGQITGISLERGTNFNLQHLTREKARSYLHSAIWREQISGLLPIVMEMGFSVNQALTHVIGNHWLNSLSQEVYGPGGQVYLEPGEVIDRMKEYSVRQVPRTLWDMLKLLRKTRNDLAHMRPVDYVCVRDLWQGYDSIRRRFPDPATPRKKRK